MHRVRGASGAVLARGPGFPPDIIPRAPPSPPVSTPPETLRCICPGPARRARRPASRTRGRKPAAEADVSGLSWSGEASTAAIFQEKDESDQADLAKLTVKELKALLKEKGKAVSGKALCTLFGQ